MEVCDYFSIVIPAGRGSFNQVFEVILYPCLKLTMKILIRSALILSPASPFHKKKKNVLINNGRIEEIGDKNYSADRDH
jgi:hypothetical protein